MSPRLVTTSHRTIINVRCAAARGIPRLRQNYHSYEHDPSPTYTPEEDAILAAAINHLPAHGFTTTALSRGIQDAGYPDVSANLFPQGVFALARYHLVTQRSALARNNAPLAPSPVSTTAVDQALAILAMPQHIATSIRELALLSDEIHFLAGDKSVDSSWYTKRAGLSAVYASTELFMTQDKSLDFKETEHFFDRRLEAAQSLRSTVRDAGQWAGVQAMSVISALRNKGVRV
ncbi:MAG: hypothetical protein Q9168_001089 [Polycauliona sp. 1 TL-2023]